MVNPFFLMALLFASVAALGALDSALTSLGLLAFFPALRWLRVHVVTLGVVVELLFGLLPLLAVTRTGAPRSRFRWECWGTLNVGLIILFVGVPLINAPLILMGGLLVFTAVFLLARQLSEEGVVSAMTTGLHRGGGLVGRRYYLAGLIYLLIGVVVGVGLWLGWSPPLHIVAPREVHIHANGFGFLALVFAGLLLDLYPSVAGRPLAWPGSERFIFWGMTLGALGLVVGPWADVRPLLLLGVLLHLSATVCLLLNVVRPLLGDRHAWTPGLLQLTTAYVWLVIPILVAPFIVLNLVRVPEGRVEELAPQALVFGWMLQYSYPLLLYALSRSLQPEATARLGGSWLSLVATHAGGLLLWASIFNEPYQQQLQAAAWSCWVVALIAIAADSWRLLMRAPALSQARE